LAQIESVLLDSGPLVATLVQGEQSHDWSVRTFNSCAGPFVTCEAVLTEAFFLLRHRPVATRALRNLLRSDLIDLSFQVDAHRRLLCRLMQDYENVPMSLADACLVRMSELHRELPVFTLDSDFAVYRRNGNEVIPLIHPTLSSA
jgi:predicted nucleic acid-binding protein